ncbi:MAG: Gfo/Idh/MocA family oxidoreductase [Gemmatimonadota bacterium]|nr:Gfo/Idh/MocA family oxidoreductase [Gemmatimonadota bacterium]
MSDNLKRRDFLKLSTASMAGMAMAQAAKPKKALAADKPIRLGFVGVGDRGSWHLDCALGIEGVEVPALCDIKDHYLHRARRWVEESGRPAPRLYGKTKTDFLRLCEEEELDCVICCTSWEWHHPVCVAAQKNGKHAVSEVPIVLTVDEAWELVDTYESTGKWATIALEGFSLAAMNMVRQGLFGDIIHAESGYVHDLRLVKFDPEREPWRLQHSINRNGNLYPDHPMRRIMPCLDINHGDRFEYLVSMSSKAQMLNEYAAQYYGDDHPLATQKMAQGDYNCTLIRTVGGKMVTLNFDTNTPHPRGFFRLQGSKGVLFTGAGIGDVGRGSLIYLDGVSPGEHRWEKADKYLEEYEHPIVKNYDPPERTQAVRGHGGSVKRTPLSWHRLVKALREDKLPDWDVYDSVTSSAISPLTEMSVAGHSKPVDFPDFTRGKWETAPVLDFK